MLKLVRQLDENKEKTKWLSHWDAENRVRVTINESVFNKINENRKLNILEMKVKNIISKQTGIQYARYRAFILSPTQEEARK